MQAAPVIAGILLVGLMAVSGFQLVPESVRGGSNTTTSLNGGGVEIDTDRLARAPRAALVSETLMATGPVITALTVKSTQDVERSTATLRGRIVVGPEELGSVFFVYGYSRPDLMRAIAASDNYVELNDDKRSSVQTKRAASSVRSTRDISARVGGLAVETDYYVQLCAELGSSLRCSAITNFETLDGPTSVGDVRAPIISVRDEKLISGEEIFLEVRLDMRDTDDGLVYVVYGESQAQVDDAVGEEYRDIDEDDEDLQKKRIAIRAIGTQTYAVELDDLNENRQHFYAVCVEYEGRRDGIVCTRVGTFTTPDDVFGDAPRVFTSAMQVSGNTAVFSGSVQMRSFRNGQAFFVHGTDENAVERSEGEKAMTAIRQNGDRLQRVLVDGDVDKSDSFRLTVPDLQFGTAYTARLCVEFKNEDEHGRDQMFVECGEVQSFTTR